MTEMGRWSAKKVEMARARGGGSAWGRRMGRPGQKPTLVLDVSGARHAGERRGGRDVLGLSFPLLAGRLGLAGGGDGGAGGKVAGAVVGARWLGRRVSSLVAIVVGLVGAPVGRNGGGRSSPRDRGGEGCDEGRRGRRRDGSPHRGQHGDGDGGGVDAARGGVGEKQGGGTSG